MSDINNPLVFLKMDSFSNGVSPDISGNQHNASGLSVEITEDDTFGNCTQFNGSGAYLKLDSIHASVYRQTEVENNQSVSYPVYSITFWIKPSEVIGDYSAYYPNNVFFSISDSQGTDLISMGFSPQGNLQLYLTSVGGSNPIPSNISVSLNEWHFIALVVNNNTYTVQMDSQSYSFTSSQYQGSGTDVNLWLGLSSFIYQSGMAANAMLGMMANMRAYNSALDSNDLAMVMAADLNSPSMQIFLPMSQSSGNTTPDYSVFGNPAILCGNPTLSADIQFGTVMNFNGTDQCIAIDNFFYQAYEPIYAITVQAWIKVDPANGSDMIIASFDKNFYWELSLESDGNTNLILKWITTDRNGIQDTLRGTIKMNDGFWHYVTGTYYSGAGIKTLYNNAQEDTVVTNAHLGLPLGKSSGQNRYGFVAAGSNTPVFNTSALAAPAFQGEMCHFRLYNSALSTAAITRNMYAGRTAAASYSLGYPLWFGLQEENKQNVIYIYDEPSGHSISCTVTNTAALPLSIAAGGTPSSENYQFAIIFRPGTLSQEALTSMQLQESSWLMSAPTVLTGGAVALYFTSAEDITVLPLSVITLTIQNVSASSAGGTRSTRLSFAYANISYYQSNSPLSGNTEITVDIINREGTKDVPLSFAFAGRNEIYCGEITDDRANQNNDDNSFSLLITNIQIGTEGIFIHGKQSPTPTRFKISFESGEDVIGNSTLLNVRGQVTLATANIRSSLNGGGSWPDPDRNDNSDDIEPFWSFTPTDSFVFQSGQCIKIDFKGVIPFNNPGNTNVYLDWEDLPGYWDGRIAIQLLKTNSVILDNGYLGLNVAEPTIPLAIGNDGYGIGATNSSLDFYTNKSPRLSLDENGNLTLNNSTNIPHNFTNVNGNIKTTGMFQVENTNQSGIQFLNGGSDNISLGIDIVNNFYIRTKSGSNYASRLTISPTGSVGIGTSPLSNVTLSVNGTTAANKTNTGGIVNIGPANGQYLQLDGSNIISKNTNSQTGPLNLTGNTVTLNGAATVNDGLTIKYGNATKLTVNSSGITFSPSIAVTGIPVVEWVTKTFDISAGTSSSGLGGTSTVLFSSVVKSATCAIQSWTLRYDGDNDHYFKMGWVNTSCTINSDRTKVDVTVSIMLSDAPGDDGNDSFKGSVTVLVLANVTKSLTV